MAGLFDNIFGGGAGSMFGGNSLYADMLTPQQMDAIRKQSMMQVAAKLLESSGPSTTRRTLGQTLGGALTAGAEAVQSGQANAVQQMLLKQKLDEAKLKSGYQKALLAGDTDEAGTAQQPVEMQSSAPAIGEVGPPAPLPAPAPMSRMDVMYNDLIRKSEIANRYGYADDAAKYLEQAFKIKPTEEYSQTPQFGQTATGTPISYVLSKSGNMKILGVQQNPDFTYQDMGGYISVRDKRNNQEVEKIKKSMSPSEQANLSLRMQETDLVESPEGYVRVPKFGPSKGTATPVLTTGGAPLASKPPEGFTKLNTSLSEMQRGLDSLRKVVNETGGPGIGLMPTEEKQKRAAAHTSFMMGVKNAFELGVLNGPDLDLIQRLIPDPNMYYSSDAAYSAALDQAQQYINDKAAAVSSSYGRPLKPVDRPNKPAEKPKGFLRMNPKTGIFDYVME